MKQRRLVIVSFLLVAVLVMGVAYAALSDNLFIKGEASVATTGAQKEFDADVYFKTASVVSTTGSNPTNAEAGEIDGIAVGQSDNDSATFKIYSLAKQGETITFSVTIENVSTEFDAIVTLDTGYPTATNDKFEIEYSTDATFPTDPVAQTITCYAGQTAIVYVRVTLIASPEVNLTSAFNVNLTATSAPKTTLPLV